MNESSFREQIFDSLAGLRIPLSREEFDAVVTAAEKKQLSHLEFLARFLSGPASERLERSIQRRIDQAKFPTSATLESFDWEFNRKTIPRAPFEQLATGDFLERQQNVAFVGKSGTGKSHLIQGIGRACCVLGYRVRYTTSADLLEDLSAAAGDNTLPNRIRYYGRFDWLIIDELGFEKLELRQYPEAPSLFYKVIDHRSPQKSTALVTNIDFKKWTDYWKDPSLTMALTDRIVDSAIIERFEGKSYRVYRAEQLKRQQQQERRQQEQGKASVPRRKNDER
jgi:DNA replication protein DnaC